MQKKVLLLLALFSLCACQHSPRKEYFALSASAADFALSEQTPVNRIVGVGPISIPEYVQHNKIAYWKTPQQLILLDNYYWAEPLERGITRVLALELQASQHDWRVMQFPWPGKQHPDYSLRLDIQRLDAFADQAILEAHVDWIDMQTRNIIASQHIRLHLPCSPNPNAIARAYSELLQQTIRTIKPPQFTRGG